MATKKVSHKRTPRKVKESSYEVTMSNGDTTGDEVEKTVTANDAENAIKKAQQRDPRKGKYDKVEVKKGSGVGSSVRTEPDTISQTKAGTQGMGGFESLSYPYNVGLPNTWDVLLERIPKRIKESLVITTRFGRLHIEIPNADVMESFIKKLGEVANGKSKQKNLAAIVNEGITRNIK